MWVIDILFLQDNSHLISVALDKKNDRDLCIDKVRKKIEIIGNINNTFFKRNWQKPKPPYIQILTYTR